MASATVTPLQTVPLLQQAVDGYGPAYARSRAVNLPRLVGAHAPAGDLDTAARTCHRVVEEITALAPPRADERLRTLKPSCGPSLDDRMTCRQADGGRVPADPERISYSTA